MPKSSVTQPDSLILIILHNILIISMVALTKGNAYSGFLGVFSMTNLINQIKLLLNTLLVWLFNTLHYKQLHLKSNLKKNIP